MTTRQIYFTDTTGTERLMTVPFDFAWLMVQTLHIAGVNAGIEFTANDVNPVAN